MPRSEDRWRPACRPLATARSRRVTFHTYKGEEPRRTVALRYEEKTESQWAAFRKPVRAFPIRAADAMPAHAVRYGACQRGFVRSWQPSSGRAQRCRLGSGW
jgi:hypothetical protein